MQRRKIWKTCNFTRLHCRLDQKACFESERTLPLVGDADYPLHADAPRPPRKMSERKHYPTPMKVLIQRANEDKEARKAQPCRMLEEPPDNGLLVPELVEVAHQVYRARQSILFGLCLACQSFFKLFLSNGAGSQKKEKRKREKIGAIPPIPP